jgi:hypothetical protein
VTLKIYNWMKKGQNMPVWLSKMAFFAQVAEASKRHKQRSLTSE